MRIEKKMQMGKERDMGKGKAGKEMRIRAVDRVVFGPTCHGAQCVGGEMQIERKMQMGKGRDMGMGKVGREMRMCAVDRGEDEKVKENDGGTRNPTFVLRNGRRYV